MAELTKEQREIIAFTRAELAKLPEAQRRRDYEAIRFMAMTTWPDKDFGPSFIEPGEK